MPKNPAYSTSDQVVLNQFNSSQADHNVKASLKTCFCDKNLPPINELYKLLYGKSRIETFHEKEIVASQFFADLIDGNSIEWIIRINGNRSKILEKLLVKYLVKIDFAIKLWQTKFKAGIYGKYGIAIIKQDTGQITSNGLKKSIPQLIPVRVIYKNQINDNIFEIEVEFEGFNYSNGKTLFTLHRFYSLSDNVVSIDRSLFNPKTGQRASYLELNDRLIENVNLSSEKFEAPFIPVSVMANDYDEIPRVKRVSSRLEMLDKFDETLAILPAWEKGSINSTVSPVLPQNNSNQNLELMKNILLKGYNEFKPINTDGNLQNLAENLVLLKPVSIMQTTKATRDLIWTEIKEDLGLPSLNDVKSAQKTSAEVIAKQFLTSPIIEREKVFVKSFLKDLAKKFLAVLSMCEIDEKMPSFAIEELEIDLEFDLTTERNINETVRQINSDSKTNNLEEIVEAKDEGEVKNETNLWRRIKGWFSARG